MLSLTWAPVLQTFLWLLLSNLSRGGSMSSWYTGLGAPQLAVYDNTTGKIYYSLCNSNSTPIFPGNDTAAFHLDIAPLNNTSIAGTGYQTDGHNVVALHYIAEKGGIAQALFHCDDTGHYVSDPNQAWIVSNGIRPPIRPKVGTGLAAIVLGETGGYRVYWQDDISRVAVLQYTRSSTSGENSWSYGDLVQQEPYVGSNNIQAGFVNTDRINVVSNLEFPLPVIQICISREHDWIIETFPNGVYDSTHNGSGAFYDLHRPTNNTEEDDLTYDQSGKWGGIGDLLEAYTHESRLGLAFNANADRLIFYIGNDSSIHQFRAIDNIDSDGLDNSGWYKSDPPDNAASAWPAADVPDAEFAIAYDNDLDKIWLYYVVNGSMTQVHQSSAGVWEPAIALPKFNATAEVAAPDPGPDDPSDQPEAGEEGAGGGLSGSGKTGVGVGVGLGIPIIGALIAYAFWNARRSRQSHEAAVDDDLAVAVAATPAVAPGSPAPQYTSGVWGDGGAGAGLGYWANGQWVQPHPDLQQQQVYGAKPDGGQWQQMDPRFSQMYAGGGSPPPPVHVHEMAHQEPAYEVAGDGQVPEMPGSQQPPAPVHADTEITPAPTPVPIPSPSQQQQRAVSPMPDVEAPPK